MSDKSNLVTNRRGALIKYDPELGLKSVAVAEVAIKHFARAKDASKLEKAIRAKLEAQAEFVLWWDTVAEKDKGGHASLYARDRSVTGRTAGKDGLPDRKTISRWRQRLNSPERLEETFREACIRYRKILEFETIAHVGQNAGEQEWYTPEEYIKAARAVLGAIDLDPASTTAANRVVKAKQIFTKRDDGLSQDWRGRLWMNPPYAQPLITQFCEKLAESYAAKKVQAALVLVNNATETQWFGILAEAASAVCFPSGRVRFWSTNKKTAAPLQGQAVLYLGKKTATFKVKFSQFGKVWLA